ncbi:oligosaccharide flippase family protein [Nocardioides sp. dk4132]|uniref:oligosaccharide flippase family protein n=1 Tax=unclassified Nocardioides TaxID=2615069 RepID=UPI001296439D|nr:MULTISPECIES: oligosaccharide flippase family protein [unclassified Nocardioides]MQW74784.1 oligosaccharide flippase family protein [Nocardioides sp. dk4132]QGA06678.1 oligosaccharide flippase family protein [Nocardioides sp. dk884]
MSALRQQVRTGLVWSALNNVVLRFGTLAVGIVLARLLSPEEFGVYAVALTVQAVLMTLADLGLSADLVRSRDPERRAPTVALLGLSAGVLLAVAMAVSAAPTARLMGTPEAAPVIALLGVTLVLAGAGVVPFGLLQRAFRQRALFVVASVDFVVSTTVTLALVGAGWGVLALAVGRIAAQSTTLVLLHVLARHRPRVAVDRSVAVSVLAFGLPVAGANMLSWALLNLDNIVVARMSGAVLLGFYVLAFNISTWPMTAIGQVVRSVALPAFARLSGRDGAHALAVGTGLTAALAIPAGALLAVLASPLVSVVYGSRWSLAAPVLGALAIFGAMRVLFDLWVSYLLARGAARTVLAVQVLWFLTLLPAVVVGVRVGGITGAGWAHVVVAVGVVLPAYAVAMRRTGADLAAVARRCVVSIAATLPAAAVAAAISRSVQTSWVALVLGGVAAGATYLLLMGRWLRRAAHAMTRADDVGAGPEPVPGRHRAEVARPESEDLGSLEPVRGRHRAEEAPARVSVVVPCYNYARFLPEAVHSALHQEGAQVEVVIVDDASTDDSLAVARELAAGDPRVRVLAHPDNRGPVATFNDGLALATGEFLVRLDADDLLTPGSLVRSVALCRRHPEVGLVYGHPLHFTDRRPPARSGPVTWTVWPGLAWLEDRCRSGVNVITSPEALMRMSVVQRVGGQRELAHTHDMEMWMRLAAYADVGYVGGADQAWHREHPASLSTTAEAPLGLTILEERRAAFEMLFSTVAEEVPAAARLRTVARAALATEALRRASYEYDRRRAPARSVAPLQAFALATYLGARHLPQWRGLQRRVRAGQAWTRWRPWWLLHPVRRIVRDRAAARQWHRTGLYRPLPATRSRPPLDEGISA